MRRPGTGTSGRWPTGAVQALTNCQGIVTV